MAAHFELYSKTGIYPLVLKNLCVQRLHEFSNGVAQFFEGIGDDQFRVETRYLFNSVRV
jgi:hypothetical protein